MLFTIIATAVLVCVSIIFWKATSPPKEPVSRGRKGSRPEAGPWDSGDNPRHGAR